MNINILPAARADIMRQVDYYAKLGGGDVANRFMDAVEASFQRLKDMPHAGASKAFSNSSLANLRSWPISGFEDIRAYYIVGDADVTVLRVLHGRRDIEGILNADEV